ncbi:MAG: DNA polymerase III subunit alpha [Rhodospirillales bacterium]
MSHADFVHLRVHTAYSLSEGAIRIKDLATLCGQNRMPAVAITDTNNLFGGLEFSVTLAQAGIQPIIGCQLSVSGDLEGSRHGPALKPTAPAADSVVVLVQNAEGYRNLLKLLAIAYRDGDSRDQPQVSLAALSDHGGGLIALTGGPNGPVGRPLLEGQQSAAEAVLVRLAAAFPGRLYVELMRHGLESEAIVEPELLRLADRFALPIVATNEAFFSNPDMYDAHDALICIAEGTHLVDAARRRLTPEHYFKGAAEMRALFSDLPDAIDNTVLIARRCAFMIEPVKPILPPCDCGPGKTEEGALRADARAGLEARLEAQVLRPEMPDEERRSRAQPYRERLDYELGVICEMGFAGYFLIVAEFIRWAKEQGIPVGPGRGSGAGSVVAWALTITDLDPLRFGLLFERFLNPERVSMPDFDIDFCQDRRDEVIRHVHDTYGGDRVAQIITFGKLQARAVLRDVGRVLGMPYGYVDKICKLVPNNPAQPVTLRQAMEIEPQLPAMAAQDDTVARLIDIAGRLEGLYRHASTHAAGVVIGDRSLEQLIPLYRDPRSSMLVTGFNMKWVEAAGLVKFDFLGLKTLTVLARAVALIERGQGTRIDLSNLPLDDPKTFELLSHGETVGVFQLESAGMRDVLRKLKPDTFEDIIAVVALYRPGPMDNIPSYIRRKHGEESPDYLYPTLEPILRETQGIMIYQEQVMQIAQELSGYSLGSADILRRAMGKKIKEEMDKQRQSFVDGACARGVPEAKAAQIFELVSKFAGYGFNKSHAAAYALVAYQTAYLKANHPVEFFAASMSLDLNNSDKLNTFRQELGRLGTPLLRPDINTSEVDFSVERAPAEPAAEAAIRFALAAVKNVGEGAMRALVAERRQNGPFSGLADVARRLDARQINKRALESLARAGAFDGLNPNRRQVFESVETLLRHASAAAEERASAQIGLFATESSAAASPLRLADVDDWQPMERLKEEFEAIGFHLSAHPLASYGTKLKRLNIAPCVEILAHGRPGPVVMAGTLIAKRERTSGKGGRYAFLQLSDTSGLFEVTVFAELLAAHRDLLEVGRSLMIRANVQVDGDAVRITAQALEPLDQVAERLSATLAVTIDSPQPLPAIRDALNGRDRGRDQVKIVSWLDAGTEVEIGIPGRYAVGPAVALRLRGIPGVRDVREV